MIIKVIQGHNTTQPFLPMYSDEIVSDSYSGDSGTGGDHLAGGWSVAYRSDGSG